MRKDIENLLRFDGIRLFKLLEMSYYTIISFAVTLLFANILENDTYMPYVFKTYDFEKASMAELFSDILIDLVVLVIFLYYLKKALSCFPFILSSLNKQYIPSMKGEVAIGIGFGSGIILYTSLKTIKDKLKALDGKIEKQLTSLVTKPPAPSPGN